MAMSPSNGERFAHWAVHSLDQWPLGHLCSPSSVHWLVSGTRNNCMPSRPTFPRVYVFRTLSACTGMSRSNGSSINWPLSFKFGIQNWQGYCEHKILPELGIGLATQYVIYPAIGSASLMVTQMLKETLVVSLLKCIVQQKLRRLLDIVGDSKLHSRTFIGEALVTNRRHRRQVSMELWQLIADRGSTQLENLRGPLG